MRDEHKVIINKENCTKCGLCVSDCPAKVIKMTDNGAEITSEKCLFCGHCVAICPVNTVSMTGFYDAPEEITEPRLIDPDIFLKQMKARRSVRKFTNEEVSKEDIAKIIEAGRYSPTAINIQGVSFVVLKKNKKEYEDIALLLMKRVLDVVKVFTKKLNSVEATENYLFKNAPLVIVIKSNNTIDGAISASSMDIMAQALGLGTFYSGMFSKLSSLSPKLKKMLKLKRGEKIVTTLVIGHPAVKYKRTAPKERPNVFED